MCETAKHLIPRSLEHTKKRQFNILPKVNYLHISLPKLLVINIYPIPQWIFVEALIEFSHICKTNKQVFYVTKTHTQWTKFAVSKVKNKRFKMKFKIWSNFKTDLWLHLKSNKVQCINFISEFCMRY